jgi:hypothetical protein
MFEVSIQNGVDLWQFWTCYSTFFFGQFLDGDTPQGHLKNKNSRKDNCSQGKQVQDLWNIILRRRITIRQDIYFKFIPIFHMSLRNITSKKLTEKKRRITRSILPQIDSILYANFKHDIFLKIYRCYSFRKLSNHYWK